MSCNLFLYLYIPFKVCVGEAEEWIQFYEFSRKSFVSNLASSFTPLIASNLQPEIQISFYGFEDLALLRLHIVNPTSP